MLPLSNCISGLSCGLVGYWTFDGKDIVNGLVIDKSGNGNHANLSNIATSTFFVPGKIGQGFNFDGSNDILNAGSAAVLDNLPAMTISMWVKLSSYGAGGGGYLINKGDASSGGHGWSLFLSQSNGLISFTARYNTTNLLAQTSANSFATSDFNKWVHIMVTWDGSANSASGVHIYKNGNELSYSAQTNGSSSYSSDAADNLNIGDGGLVSGRQTNGIIDDVRIYNRVLSSRELSQIYLYGASAKQSASTPINIATSTCSVGLSCGLITYWTFDGKDIVNGLIRDKSGSGTVANTANISTSTFYTAGVKGQALRFGANNDYIFSDLGTARSTFTISLWYTPQKFGNWQSNQTGFQMGKTSYNESTFYRWYSTGGNPKIQASSNNGGSAAASTVYSSETRLPYLNTFVYTPTQIDWYINGVLYNSTTPSVGTFDAMRFITLGGTGNANQSVNGVIDEFRMYDRALTAGEIKQLYTSIVLAKQSSSQDVIQNSSCISGLSCGLVGYWTFDGKDMIGGVAR
ncbi:LamG domain-containing protein, partial [bacterium]|nr:LamG domain-containing protein [bacterium]